MDETNLPSDAKLQVWEDEGGRLRPVPATAHLALYDRLLALLLGRFGGRARDGLPAGEEAGAAEG